MRCTSNHQKKNVSWTCHAYLVYMHVSIYIYICIHTYMYVYICTYTYIYMYIYIYIYMYIYIWLHWTQCMRPSMDSVRRLDTKSGQSVNRSLYRSISHLYMYNTYLQRLHWTQFPRPNRFGSAANRIDSCIIHQYIALSSYLST